MSTTDIIARGLISQTRTELASNADGQGSAKVGFSATAATGSTRTVQDKLRETVSVKDFGALGNGANDDTGAIQAAINATLATGGALYFPRGTYKITSKLVIPSSQGWKMFGESREGARIKQFTSNTRIFSFETENTWGWEISELALEWNTQQTNSNTQAIAIYFGQAGASSGYGFYDWQVRRISFSKGFRAIAANSTNSPPLWGCQVSECAYGSTMVGAFFFAVPSPVIGQPNISIESNTLNCSAADEPPIQIVASTIVTLRNLEFLNGSHALAGGLISISSSTVSCADCKAEGYNLGTGGGSMFAFPDCVANVANVSCVMATGSAGNSYFVYGPANATMTIDGLSATTNMTGGNLIAYFAAAIPFVAGVRLNALGSGHATDNVRAILGNVAVPKFNADKRQMDFITDIGDVNVALTATSDAIQYQNVALTANRTITLPNTGLYEGMAFHIVRRAGTPGAFTLQVTDPIGANNYTFASSTNGYVKYRAKNNTWRIIEAGPV